MQDLSTPDHAHPAAPITPPQPAAYDNASILWTFTLTTFVSALLLFSIQPMFAKMVLPVLGGSPSVWAVAMCFFQGALLAGYCYAHLLITKAPLRISGLIHLCLCVVAFLVLPIGLPRGFGEPPPGAPYLWQLGLFTAALGLPFLAVAANAPLLQAWFRASGHSQGRDPYFLYAASNLGSLIALLAYPFVLEPAFGVSALARFWTIGFVLLVGCLAASFWLLRRASDGMSTSDAAPILAATGPTPDWRQRAGWVGLALVPSALLTAFTTHVTTDVASAPLLWVLPLALYLLTFVLVFRERALIPRRVLLAVHLAAVIGTLLLLSQTKHESWFFTATAGVIVFFTSAMVAHRTLYEARPDAGHLTEFYLWMSLGGALGGLAAALLAPKIFSEVFEYPLLLALSMACRPGALTFKWRDRDEGLVYWLLLAIGLLAIYWVPWTFPKIANYVEKLSPASAQWMLSYDATAFAALLLAAVMIANWRHPTRQLVMALLMFAALIHLPSGVKRGEAQRSYFGVYRVMQSADGHFNILIHGTTLHGAQRIKDEEGKPVIDHAPATYYYENSPMARVTALRRESLAERTPSAKGRYGVIGLGTGSMTCHSEADERWRIFEIDPLMVGIASSGEHFTFLANCMPKPDIVIGDARLTMTRETDGSFDLIVVDAFSSDAVPVHLMTAEAIRLYLSKVADDGIVLLHISNRYLDLETVLGATIGAVPGAHGLIISDDEADGTYAQSSSTVALFAKSAAALEPYRELTIARELQPGRMKAWTDDYSDVLSPFLSQVRKHYWPSAKETTVEKEAAE